MNVFVESVLICSIVRRKACSYALKIFEYLGKFPAICIYSGSLKILDPWILPFPSMLGAGG